jgi:hypothetical protein
MRKRMGVLALAVALAFGVQGCYGKFALTKKVHQFNGSMGNKFVNELMFLVMIIVPVYSIASLIDAVIINSIEFWSGKNPMASKVVTDGDKMVTMDFDQTSGLVKVSYFHKGVLQSEGFLRKGENSIELLDAAKQTVKAVATTNSYGEAYMADASGMVLAESLQR